MTTVPRNVAEAIGATWTPAEADAVARAYAAGHRDGVGCGIESAGFGFVECEHVGRLQAGPAAVRPVERETRETTNG